MISVVDACVAIKWYIQEEGHPQAMGLLEGHDVLVAPDYLEVEFTNIVSKKLRVGQISEDHAGQMLGDLGRAVTRLEPTRIFLADALDLSRTLSHPIYDCIYLAMARAIGGQVITADRKFADKVGASHLSRWLVTLSDYIPSLTPTAETFPDWQVEPWFSDFMRLAVQVHNTTVFSGGDLSRARAERQYVVDSPAWRRLRELVKAFSDHERRLLVTTCLLPIHGQLGSAWRNAQQVIDNPDTDVADYLVKYLSWFDQGCELLKSLAQSQHST